MNIEDIKELKLDRENLKDAIENLKTNILIGESYDNFDSLQPIAAEYFLLAVSALDQATRYVSLMNYY